MGTLACAVGELWALVNLLRLLEGRDFSSRVAAQITAGILVRSARSVLALPLGGHDARSPGPADDALLGAANFTGGGALPAGGRRQTYDTTNFTGETDGT